jgi:6-phosphogluconolactonase
LTHDVRILPDVAAIAKRAAQLFTDAANAAVRETGAFSVALSGGSTPKALHSLLVSAPFRSVLPWDKIRFYFGDERHVPPDHQDSNFRMANETLLSKAPIKPDQIYRIRAEYPDAEKTALEYQQTLRSTFRLSDGQLPRFDLVLLGMGNEGHVLSLFPGTKALHDNGRLVMHNWVGKFYTERITITAPVANNAGLLIFMIAGVDKAPALKAVLEGPYEPEQLPSQLIQPANGKLVWLVDAAAAGMLSIGIREELTAPRSR